MVLQALPLVQLVLLDTTLLLMKTRVANLVTLVNTAFLKQANASLAPMAQSQKGPEALRVRLVALELHLMTIIPIVFTIVLLYRSLEKMEQ
jgi:hypothetical protein